MRFIKQKCQNHLLTGIYLRIIHVHLAHHNDTQESTLCPGHEHLVFIYIKVI